MERLDVKKYEVTNSDGLLFDTNVWMYIFGPMASIRSDRQTAYSKIFKDAISRKATIFISSQIVSEYINAILRIGFKNWMSINQLKNADFKHDYRQTSHYLETLEDARDQIEQILKYTEKSSDSFQNAPVLSIIDRMKSVCDYNDSFFLWFSKEPQYKIVTDDQDMLLAESNIKIITFN